MDGQNRFLECSKGDALHGLFVLALDTGIRLGELLALTWNDVDFDNETIHVNKNLITVKYFDNTAESNNILMIQDAPKTKASIRKVPLTKRSLALLKEMNPDQSETGLIFRTKTKNLSVREMQNAPSVVLLPKQASASATSILPGTHMQQGSLSWAYLQKLFQSF